MDPEECKPTNKLLRFRQTTIQKLNELQCQSDSIILDDAMDVDSKQEIDHFQGKIIACLLKMHADIAAGSDRVLDKLRQNYGNGLLHTILIENWSVIPSTLQQLDPLTTSDVLQLQVVFSNPFKTSLNCIKLNDFLHAIRLNWMHRYFTLNYNDFWTSLLDSLL